MEHQLDRATAAYVYGYPMVYNVTEIISQTTAPKVPYVGPVNLFGHATRLADEHDEFVSLNNDTLYSFAHCDVSPEPLVLHLPDTDDRYYVMQFVDPWTNNFAYLGRRSFGTKEGYYLLATPEWSGPVPEGVRLLTVPNSVFSIIGRYAVNGEADIPNVERLQQQTWLTPLSQFPEPPATEDRKFGDWDIAPWNADVPEALAFWEKFRSWMALFPPPAADEEMFDSLRALGLFGGPETFLQPTPELAAELAAGTEKGLALIEEVATKGTGNVVNGWVQAMHSFDYNLDRLGPGTIDNEEWKIPLRSFSWINRAGAARGGLWGNHGYEANYCITFVDSSDAPLSGDHQYVLHFDQPPPVDAFWSLTMYNIPQYYLVSNPINRYSIGDRTPGLQYNPDGSIDIAIQTTSPGSERESNWLPAPSGPFRPLLRMYQPQESILDGSYELPAIQRIDSD